MSFDIGCWDWVFGLGVAFGFLGVWNFWCLGVRFFGFLGFRFFGFLGEFSVGWVFG